MRFQAMSLSKVDLEERFDIELSDEEWKLLKYYSSKSWSDNTEELRSLIIKHIRNGLSEIGYKPIIEENQLRFKKKD